MAAKFYLLFYRSSSKYKFPKEFRHVWINYQQLNFLFFVFCFFVSPILIYSAVFILIESHITADDTKSKFMLKDLIIHDIVIKQYELINVNHTVKKAVAMVLDSKNKNFLITEEGVPVGTLNRDQIIVALSN